jgi:molybdate transport system substrate-binding protein
MEALMATIKTWTKAILAGVTTAVLTTAAPAADIKVLATTALSTVFEELQPRFEKASGHKLIVVLSPSGALNKRVADGEAADLLISSVAGVDALIKDGKLTGPRVLIAQSGMGVAVKAGAPKPDISNPEALKKALLAAKAVAYTDPKSGGASGIHFLKVLEQLGIAEQVNKSAKLGQGGPTADFVVKGEADIAVQQIPELKPIAGIDIVGPLPGNLQSMTVFASGVLANAMQADAARALIAFLGSPEALAVIKDKGLEPAPAPGRAG